LKRLQQLAHWVGSAANTAGKEPTWKKNVDVRLTILVTPRIPWKRFLESAFLHVIVVGMLLGFSKIQPREVLVSPEPLRNAHVTYYPSSQSYPARESSRAAAPKRQTPAHASARHGITAREEFKPQMSSEAAASATASSGEAQKLPAIASLPKMPNVASGRSGKPGLGVANPMSPPPDFATAESRRFKLPNTSGVAPSPDLSSASGSRTQSGRAIAPGAPVIPPSPELEGSMSRSRSGAALGRGSAATDIAIVAPPPAISDHEVLTYRASGVTDGAAQVVAPPPSIQAGLGARRVISANGRGSERGSEGSSEGSSERGSEIVPPPPSIERSKSARGGPGNLIAGSGSQVVPPAPSIQSSGKYGEGGRLSSLAGKGLSQIVPPSPSLGGGNALPARHGNLLAGGNSTIVPPAPSIQGGGRSAESGRIGLLGGKGASQIVPPTPSLESGRSLATGRGGWIGSSTAQVAPPAPSIQGGGKYAGGRISSLAPGVSQVVPPPPGVQDGVGSAAGGARLNSLANGGAKVVPPPPSAEGRGGLAGGRATSLGDAAAQGPSSPAATDGAGNSESGASGVAQDASVPSAPEDDKDTAQPGFHDVQLHVISLAWAPQRSSFFSSFEVFIAEKWLRKDKSQLIKLVYVFLPYQQRLSEYASGDLNVRKLRVTRDPTCDESLIQMTWPEGEDGKGVQKQEEPASSNGKDLLPCYRTTADDYRRAISHNR